MQFCDEVKVTFMGGKGGNGCVSFRREKYVPRGGPDGGDGGNGASIFLVVDPNVNTLSEFNTYKTFRGKSGENGGSKKMAGKGGEDIFLKVPPGTMVLNNQKKLLADLKEIGEKFCVASGGKGGFGNTHFTKATRQAPTFAELGEPGTKKEVTLELKLVADVGVIGIPSVGKSSFIARVSSARPKIADYPFTTLVPNLGVCYLSSFGGKASESFVVCDVPGLIENAHKGKGLGIEFLKHIQRNRILLHLLDIGSENFLEDYETIIEELRSFDPKLLEKPQIVALNKIDLLDEKSRKEKQKKLLKKHPEIKKQLFLISCATGEGLQECVLRLFRELQKIPKESPEKDEVQKYQLYRLEGEENPNAFSVRMMGEKEGVKHFEVKGKRIEQIVRMTDFRNDEAVSRVYNILTRHGMHRELIRQGAREGAEIHIAEHTLEFHEDMDEE